MQKTTQNAINNLYWLQGKLDNIEDKELNLKLNETITLLEKENESKTNTVSKKLR